MADKNYKINFELSDGSTKSVEFTSPQGDKGDPGRSIGVFVTDYGASPSASAADNTDAFKTALAENRVVYVPGGTYELNDTLTIGANCCLELSQDTVLKFTQTNTHGISMLRSASLRGNHATIFVPYTFSANAINCDGGDDYNALDPNDIAGSNTTAVPPFKKWDPQWKMSRYVTDINICKPNSSGFHYSNDGTCYGNAIYVHSNVADYPVSFMWGVSMSGIRICGGFNYGIRLHNIGEHEKCWNHDARIEAVIDACKIGVLVENAYYNHLAVTIQPRRADDGTAYAEHGVKIVDSWGTDLSSYRVWDWTTKKDGKTINSKWEPGNEYQHLALYGNCTGTLLDGFLTYAQSTYDIRELIYTDTPSNFDTMTVIQEPVDKRLKNIEGSPYFFDGAFDQKVITQTDLDAYFDTDTIKAFEDLLPSALGADGSILGGKGYKSGILISSTGNESPSGLYTSTGFIPCSNGAEVHVKGMNMKEDPADSAKIVLYKANKEYLMVVNRAKLIANSSDFCKYRETDNGCVFTIGTGATISGAAFIRISVHNSCVGDDLMVAVNQEIKYTQAGFLADAVKVKSENVILQSPDGTQFVLSVGNDGTITATPRS